MLHLFEYEIDDIAHGNTYRNDCGYLIIGTFRIKTLSFSLIVSPSSVVIYLSKFSYCQSNGNLFSSVSSVIYNIMHRLILQMRECLVVVVLMQVILFQIQYIESIFHNVFNKFCVTLIAIHLAAGPELRTACYGAGEVRPGIRCPTGAARMTP